MWTRIPYSARIGLPVRQYVMGAAEAARKPILPHGKIRTEKNGKNSTEHYGIPNFRRFRKSLATSTCNGTVVVPNGFGSSTFRLECSLIARPRTPARHSQNLQQPVAAGCKHSDSKSNTIVWTSTTPSAWWRICGSSKAMANLRGKGAF